MIETQRLILKPLSYNELIKHVKIPEELANEMGLFPSKSLIENETKEAILNDLLPHLSNPGKDPLFYTMWIVIEKNKKAIIGGICFHGEPDPIGEVEIGYGIDEDYRNNGYMTETIAGLIRWAKSNHRIKSIRAETDNDNKSSIKVLEKNGFVITRQGDDLIHMKLEIIN
jgi:[ribosomal protein S5]-alanine N-acetyltransferase